MLVDTSFLLVYVHDGVRIECVDCKVRCRLLIGALDKRDMLHDHDSSICIGEVDVGADLSRSTHCSCLAELAQGQTFGPWESN